MANAIIAEFEKQQLAQPLEARKLQSSKVATKKQHSPKNTPSDTPSSFSIEDPENDPVVPLEKVAEELGIDQNQAIVLAQSLDVDHKHLLASEADVMVQLWREQQLKKTMTQAVQNVEQTQGAVAAEALRQSAQDGYDLAQTTAIVYQQSFLYGLLEGSEQTLNLFSKLHHSHQSTLRDELKNCTEGLHATAAGNPTMAEALQTMTNKTQHFQNTDKRRQAAIRTQRFNWTK